jgi:hypothetical protein
VGYVISEGKQRRFGLRQVIASASSGAGGAAAVAFIDLMDTTRDSTDRPDWPDVDVVIQKADTPAERAVLAAFAAAHAQVPIVDPPPAVDALADRHAAWLLLKDALVRSADGAASAPDVRVPPECELEWPPRASSSIGPAAAGGGQASVSHAGSGGATGVASDTAAAAAYVERTLVAAGMTFPLVLKPAAGSSHAGVCIAHDAWGVAVALLARADTSDEAGVTVATTGERVRLAAQQFVDHGGVLFKVCVLGGAVIPVQRASVADGGCLALAEPAASVSAGGPGSLVPLGRVSKHGPQPSVAGALPPLAAISAAATAIRAALGLSLFNFDFVTGAAHWCEAPAIRNVHASVTGDGAPVASASRYYAPTPVHYVLDVNYFPSFDGVPDMPALLLRHLAAAAAACTHE